MNTKTLKKFLKTINPELLEDKDKLTADIKSPEALRRTHAMTVALLQHAYQLIDQAEQQLETQSARIESLENLAVTDELTGILNRRGFEKAVTRELERLQRGQTKTGAFALLDLDDFKLTNDRHGHYVGDLCLKMVASCLKDIIRTTDVAGRLGGDEFALFLSDVDEKQAAAKMAIINDRLNQLRLIHQGKNITIGASLGFVMAAPASESYTNIYDRADRMMYERKTAQKAIPQNSRMLHVLNALHSA